MFSQLQQLAAPQARSVREVFTTLAPFIGRTQRAVLLSSLKSEEGPAILGMLNELAERVSLMPMTYEQDGLGDQATVYLHYFRGACDWYITERDQEPEQLQAFGLANLGHGGELGYISIVELVRLDIELDLHFTPTPLAAIKGARS
jgi:hypothetical protein